MMFHIAFALTGAEAKIARAYNGTAQACTHLPNASRRQVLSSRRPGFPTQKVNALFVVQHCEKEFDFFDTSPPNLASLASQSLVFVPTSCEASFEMNEGKGRERREIRDERG